MKIVLLGANGRTGREILGQAIKDGHTVTAVVRNEDRLADWSHPQLEIHAGNVCEPNALKKILSGHDIVISTLGPRLPTKKACRIYSMSAKAIVSAMKESSVNRLLITSTALLYPPRNLLDRILGIVARHNARNAASMEATISSSNLEWTIARVGFLHNEDSIDYRTASGALPERGSSISRAAVARFLMDEARQADYVGKIVGLGN